jgi:hypothetical protein
VLWSSIGRLGLGKCYPRTTVISSKDCTLSTVRPDKHLSTQSSCGAWLRPDFSYVAPPSSWHFCAARIPETMLSLLFMGLIGFGVALWELRKRVSKAIGRSAEVEMKLWNLGIYVSDQGLRVGSGTTYDPLHSASYDPSLPPLAPKED